jgi:calcium-dependent protein kinase
VASVEIEEVNIKEEYTINSGLNNHKGTDKKRAGTAPNIPEINHIHEILPKDLRSKPKAATVVDDTTKAGDNLTSKSYSLSKSFNKERERETVDIKGPISNEIFFSIKNTPILDDYEFKKELGEGSYGQVKLGLHKRTGLNRAIKIIKKNEIPEDERNAMLKEVSILKSLDHPNIIKMFDMYQDDIYYYIVIEYCSGGELFDRVKDNSDGFSEKEAAGYLRQLLSALSYLHSRQIVHRDLKAENLLFENERSDANMKLIDFGVSCEYFKGKKLKETLGTPYYIAPEVLLQSYDEKCDIWSCGVILYIILCGYPPFSGDDDKDILENVKKGDFIFDSDWDGRSDAAKDLIRKMLQMNPKKRITAADALKDPWIMNNNTKPVLKQSVLENLFNFHVNSRFRHAIMTFMTSLLMSKAEKEELMIAFQALDTDGNGVLTIDELKEGYKKIYPTFTEEEIELAVQTVVSNIDVNGSGQIDFTEFVVASVNQHKLLTKNSIAKAFKLFDNDGDGNIDRKELKMVMGGVNLSDGEWDKLINQYDADQDGKISLDEFTNMLLEIAEKK